MRISVRRRSSTALADGADIVITGRVADPSLVVAACVHHFGWNENDLDRLAGATVAGHLIECGTQVTGGISTDWLDVPDAAHIGFPIVEVSEDGSCIVTKPRGTGGCVTAMTVKEQLVYEIGDPENYLSPDVAVSFLSLAVEDLGNDRVRVSGATGKPRPETYKVSATFRDGFRSAGTLTIIGRNAVAKAPPLRRTGFAARSRGRFRAARQLSSNASAAATSASKKRFSACDPNGISEKPCCESPSKPTSRRRRAILARADAASLRPARRERPVTRKAGRAFIRCFAIGRA